MTPVGGLFKRLRTIKGEKVDLWDDADYTDDVCQVGRFLNDVYLGMCIHPFWMTAVDCPVTKTPAGYRV